MIQTNIKSAMLGAVLAGMLHACGFTDGKFNLDFSAKQIQDAIAPKFPAENCPLPITCIKLQNPKITLADGSDRLTLAFDTTVSLLGQPTTGTAVVSVKTLELLERGLPMGRPTPGASRLGQKF